MIRVVTMALVGLAACGGRQQKQDYQALGQELQANTTERQVAPSTSLAPLADEMKRGCEFASASNATSGSIQVEVVTATCQRVITTITLTRSSQGTKLSYYCARSGGGGEVIVVPATECRGVVEPYLGGMGGSSSGGGQRGMPSAPGGAGTAAPSNGAVPDNLFGPAEQPQQKPDDGIRIED